MTPLDAFVPAGPDWQVDWEGLERAFPWTEELRACPQDPLWHGEGDVWTHTRMVVDALAGMEDWRALDEVARRQLFLAALLHDIGKPACTETEPDGRISSRGHSRRGESMARLWLWRAGMGPHEREPIAALIRSHQYPFFLLDRDDARGEAIRLSHDLRCDRLGLLAEADARGRIARDRDRLVDNTRLFRDFCAEMGCLETPWPFASDHSRFEWFRKPGRDPAYAAHDDTGMEVVLMSGLPAAGKDSWIAANAPDLPVVSLDAIRGEFGVAPSDGQGKVIAAARERAREHLRAKKSFVWNATNLSRRIRAGLIDLFADYNARVRIVYLEGPPAEQQRRNAARRNPVPDSAIGRMLNSWEPPKINEAHQVDWIDTTI
jgi:predicted kinase